MSHKNNTEFLEASNEHFHSFLEVGDWKNAKAVCKEVEDAGFSSESFKLTNDMLIAQREAIKCLDCDGTGEVSDGNGEHWSEMGTKPCICQI